MSEPPSSDMPSQSPPDLPGQGVRTAVNLLLFVHLFCLAIVLVMNHSTSALRIKLQNFPTFYLSLFYMDVDFGGGVVQSNQAEGANLRLRPRSRRALYHLTQSEAVDVGHFVEVEVTRDGETKVVEFPSADLWPRQRYRRYQMLAWEVGRLVGNEDTRLVLPQGIARCVLRRNGVDQGKFRCRRLYLQSTADVSAADPTIRDPWDRRWTANILEANALLANDEVLFDSVSTPEPNASGSGSPGVEENAPVPTQK